MKKKKAVSLLFLCLCIAAELQNTVSVKAAGAELITSPHGILVEASTGTVLFEKDADTKVRPASITKIMTLILIFEELDKGTLKMDDLVTTSAHAKSMGGSQVYLEEGEQQTVETMIKCIVIASGNDASVAMAEHIEGSEAEFVARMNQKAIELGMENTNFQDCCGLTDSEEHYTTARDVAVMSRELVEKHPEILKYSSIWMENITHVTRQGSSEFGLTNTNKLIRSYDGCLGLKTGSTSLAKYCVSAVAVRNDITLISVVMTAPDYKVRFNDAAAMLNYGFSCCQVYEDKEPLPLTDIAVTGSIQERAECEYGSVFRYVDTEGNDLSKIEIKIHMPEETEAPVQKGEKAGEAVYLLNGKEIGKVDILFSETVEKSDFTDYFRLCLERTAGFGREKSAA